MDQISESLEAAALPKSESKVAPPQSAGASVIGAAGLRRGLGEDGNFPACIKTVAEWFPKKERALATGIFNAGTNVGVLVGAVTVPWLTINYGWRWTFVVTGLTGFAWLAVWLAF